MASPPAGDRHAASTQTMRFNAACVLLCAVAVAFELLALWLIVSANTRAQRQADAVVATIKRASAVEFSLQPQTLYRYNQLHQDGRSMDDEEAAKAARADATGGVVVTGRLVPRLSEDTGRLRFDGRMRVRRNVTLPSSGSSSSSSSSSSASPSWNEAASGGGEEEELLVLKQQRGVRYASGNDNNEYQEADGDGMKCLLPRDLPPLYTVESAGQTAFTAQSFASFGAQCKRGRPLEVLFDRSPFIMCVLDWFDALNACVGSSASATNRRYHQPMLFPTPSPTANKGEAMTATSSCNTAPPLVIYGEHVVLEATLVFSPTESELSADSTRAMTHCQLLEAPMATAALASQSVLFHLLPRPTLSTSTNASNGAQLTPLM